MANPMLHPQFFATLVPGFHTHLTIPVNFFSKYIERKSVEKTAELKSDASDVKWEVKITGRRLSNGWEEFAVAQNLQIGDVLVLRYEGDLVFHVSNLGTSSCQIQDLPNSSNNNNVSGRNSSYYGGDCGDDIDVDDGDELLRKKKVKKSSPKAEASFVGLVTASTLRTDTLYIPQHFTSSNGFTRKCHKIVLTDGGERSWAFDLKYNKSSDTFHISRGWKKFCDENSQGAGGFFMFKLVSNRGTPVLSFYPKETISDGRQKDCSESRRRESLSIELSSKEENIERESSEDESSEDECSKEENIEGEISEDECREFEKKKYSPKQRVPSYSSYSPCHKQFVTYSLPPDYVKLRKLSLPMPFLRENGINKPGEIYLLDKNGTKWLTNLLLDAKGTMALGKGWKAFVQANSLETGFTLKLIWEETTPLLSLYSAHSSSDTGQDEFPISTKEKYVFINPSNRGMISKYENNKEASRSCRREKNHLRLRDSPPSSQNQFVTLTITPYSVKKCKLHLPRKFTRVNDIKEPGVIILLGKDGIRQQTRLLYEKEKNAMNLGKGWKEFVKENGLKMGDSFKLKLIWEDTTPVLSLCPAECSSDSGPGLGCSETNQKKSLPIEPSSCKKLTRDEISKEENRSLERKKNHMRWRYSAPSSQKEFLTSTITPNRLKASDSTEPRSSTSTIQNRFVTLRQTPEDVGACQLHLPSQFVRANGIKKLGKIILLGEQSGLEWSAYLLTRDGTVALGIGWDGFCEANGVKLGDNFTLEFVCEQDNTSPLLKLYSRDTKKIQNFH